MRADELEDMEGGSGKKKEDKELKTVLSEHIRCRWVKKKGEREKEL